MKTSHKSRVLAIVLAAVMLLLAAPLTSVAATADQDGSITIVSTGGETATITGRGQQVYFKTKIQFKEIKIPGAETITLKRSQNITFIWDQVDFPATANTWLTGNYGYQVDVQYAEGYNGQNRYIDRFYIVVDATVVPSKLEVRYQTQENHSMPGYYEALHTAPGWNLPENIIQNEEGDILNGGDGWLNGSIALKHMQTTNPIGGFSRQWRIGASTATDSAFQANGWGPENYGNFGGTGPTGQWMIFDYHNWPEEEFTITYEFRFISISGVTGTTKKLPLKIDNRAPVMTAAPTAVAGESAFGAAATWKFTDKNYMNGKVTYKLDGEPVVREDVDIRTVKFVEAGTYADVKVYDSLGNARALDDFIIDLSKPEITLAQTALGVDLKNGPIQVDISENSNKSVKYQYQITSQGEWTDLDGSSLVIYPDPSDSAVINKQYRFRAISTTTGNISAVKGYTPSKQSGIWLKIGEKAYTVAPDGTLKLGGRTYVNTIAPLYYDGATLTFKETDSGKTVAVTQSMVPGTAYTGTLAYGGNTWTFNVEIDNAAPTLAVAAKVGNKNGAEYVKNQKIGGANAKVYFKLDVNAATNAVYYSEDNGTTWKKFADTSLKPNGDVGKYVEWTLTGKAGELYNSVVRFKAVTAYGVEKAVTFGAVSIDKAAPVLQESPATLENGYTAYAGTVKFIFDKAVTVAYTKDGTAATTASARTISFTGDGEFDLVSAADTFGNVTQLSDSFTISGAKPNLTLSATSGGKKVTSGAELTADLTFTFASSYASYYVQVSVDGGEWTTLDSNTSYTLERANDINGTYQFRLLNANSGAVGAARSFTVNFEQVAVIPAEVIAAAEAEAQSTATSYVNQLVFQQAFDWANEGVVDMAPYVIDNGRITEDGQYAVIDSKYYKHAGAYAAVKAKLYAYMIDNAWYLDNEAGQTAATNFTCFLLAVGAVGDAGYEEYDRNLLTPMYEDAIREEWYDLYYQDKYDEVYDAYIEAYLASQATQN
ncbi:MAG: hypothetical protein LBC65_02390 [Oscillospiraceae bacterium]|jgi:hypothetical protein|nr:hypothetical protein [Oscillospiraceae bacterium]